MKNYKFIPTGSKAKSKIPHCPHGPNLLLESVNEDNRRTYVCSANRTNDCKQFFNFDVTRFKREHGHRRQKAQKRLLAVLKAVRQDRHWCIDCSEFFLPDEHFRHEQHMVKKMISKKLLRRPTRLISALIDRKEEAQYFFSQESLKLIVQTIRKLGFTHVLCIGCPSVHEHLQIYNTKKPIQSMLLDIDKRYMQFYSSNKFLCFNMVNNYCFEPAKLEQKLDTFLRNSDKLLVLMDPPFGALMPALCDTLKKLMKRIKYLKGCKKEDESVNNNETEENLSAVKNVLQDENLVEKDTVKSEEPCVMLFHLYFFEKRIQEEIPSLKMIDFQLTYANHSKMNGGKGSIARIFTNIPRKEIKLPRRLGYKYCKQCERWVHKAANHCPDCKDCCSKDGKPSVHCAVCDKCVKITWDHCFACEMCTLKGKCKCGGKSKENYYMDDDNEDDFNRYSNFD